MTLHIQYDKNKVQHALRYHFISRPEIKIMLILVNVFALFSAVVFGFKLIGPAPFLISSVLWFSLMIIFWFLMPRIIYKRNATFKEQIDLSFRTDDILLETQRGHANWAYNKFQYYIESPFFFHLYMNEKSFFLLPKEACVGDTDTSEVRHLLDEKIGRRK